ncbi:hypothetical protein BC941DRAFT_363794 [Chlamydoabsidia padenii]|nr:hypothetical protein BC941DRAFT_363794 [Chlamydoabsidia padenii]
MYGSTKASYIHPLSSPEEHYDDEDDSTTTVSTGATLSTLMDQDNNTASSLCLVDTPTNRSSQITAFETSLQTTCSPSRNTYFLDGGNRFISLPTLGNAHTKTAGHVSRIVEEWLQDKLYHQPMTTDRLAILEDSVDLLAEDIMNKLKSRSCVRGLGTGVAKMMIKIRTGHVYCFDQLMQQDALLTPDMMDFIQQFPLFLDTCIHIESKSTTLHSTDDDDGLDHAIPVLLCIENVSTNPSDPYYLFENVSLIV